MSLQIPGNPGESLAGLKVVVENVLFSSRDNGYAVIAVRPHGYPKGNYVFTAVGTVGEVRQEERVILSGDWTTSKYGVQLKISSFQFSDLSGENMKEFLLGGFIAGIGPKLGNSVWEKFGGECLRIFEEDISRLLEVKGIKEAKLVKIKESWEAFGGKRTALVEFSRLGLHSGIIKGIFARWQNPLHALERIRQNPYLLAWEISGVGFHTADNVARQLGFAFDCQERIGAALGFALNEAAKNEGHCFLPVEDLFNRIDVLLDYQFEYEFLMRILQQLVQDQKVIFLKNGDYVHVYLRKIGIAEFELSKALKKISYSQAWHIKNLDSYIAQYEKEYGISLHENQKKAVKMACENQCCVLTGGPGTGKTTIIKCIIAMLNKLAPEIDIALAAPTGRAAKRATESTGLEAKTIHRLLAYSPHEGFAFNEDNPLPADVIIVDESSMLDVRLADKLLAAMKPGSRMVFVGDVNQLPSVGAGSVLKDIISSGKIPVTSLSQIYRQSEGSFIALNASAILAGQFSNLNLSNKTDDFFYMGLNNPRLDAAIRQSEIRKGLVNCVKRLLACGQSLNDIQILCPMKNGPVGTVALNTLLQSVFNPAGRVVYTGRERIFKEGDKVMQIRNNYDKYVFNGDQGVVESCSDDGSIFVRFDSELLEYTKEDINELVLSYAMTVHKAQGSEAKVAIVILSYSHYVMLSRPIFYTAVTRARNMCVIIGETAALKKAVENNNITKRNTNLASLLADRVNMVVDYAA